MTTAPLLRRRKTSLLLTAAATAALALGCDDDRRPPPDPYDAVLAAVRCEPWRPSGDADWSSLPASRPGVIGPLSASPSGTYLYSVGTWLDAGTVKRQILRSPDLGKSWCVLPTPDPVAEIAVSPASGAVIYALTWAPAGGNVRLIKTIDGGATWSSPAAGLPEGISLRYDGQPASPLRTSDPGVWDGVSPLQTSFTDPGVVWLQGLSSVPLLYRSGDGGESWALVPFPADLQVQTSTALGLVEGYIVDPTSATRVLAWGTQWTIGPIPGPTTFARYVTEDAGASWREIAVASLLVDAGSTLYAPADASLLRSTDWGETWHDAGRLPELELSTLTTLGSRRGGRLLAQGRLGGAWRSSDGGATWRPLSLPSELGFLQLVLAPGPTDDVLVGASYLGVSATTDGGRTWKRSPTVPSVTALFQSPADGRRRIWRDGGLQSADGGLTWTAPAGERWVSPLLFDGSDGEVAFHLGQDDSHPSERTEDGGRTWTAFAVPAGSVDAAATCPGTSSCLYVLLSLWFEDRPQTCRLARSDDRGRTWTEIPAPSELCYGRPMVVSPEDREHLLAGCGPAVCETRDGGRSWTHHPVGDGKEFVEHLVFLRSGVALATTNPHAPRGETASPVVARSTDGGSTWVDVMAAGGILIGSGARPETAFLIRSGSNGDVLHRSDDGGATWRVISPPGVDEGPAGTPRFAVQSIVDSPRGGFVVATTFGLVHID